MNYQDIIGKYGPSQNFWELGQALQLIKAINPKVILEIGVHMGGTYKVWRDVFKPEILVGIEWSDEFEYPDLNVVRGQSQLEETKDKVIEKLQNKPVDFLFIDGGHKYEEVEIHRLWEEIKNNFHHIEIHGCNVKKANETGIGLLFI